MLVSFQSPIKRAFFERSEKGGPSSYFPHPVSITIDARKIDLKKIVSDCIKSNVFLKSKKLMLFLVSAHQKNKVSEDHQFSQIQIQ